MRIALFIGIILFFFPVSYALQEPLAESSVYEPRAQSSFSELLRNMLELMDSIRTFISLVPIMISVTLDALSRLAAGELRYTDVAWCFDIIRVLARELGLSQTYGAFVNAVMALTTGSLTVDDVYAILMVLPPLLREAPGAIARWLSMAYNVGFEIVFAPIAGLITGLVIGGIAGVAIFIFSILFFSIITFLIFSAMAFLSSIGIAIFLAIVAIALFIGSDILLFMAVVVFVALAILSGIFGGALLGVLLGGLFFLVTTIFFLIFGFIWTIFGLLIWAVFIVGCAAIGAALFGFIALFISAVVIGIAILSELFLLFVALPAVILFIFVALIFIGVILALFVGLFVGLPVGAISGGILGLIAFFTVTPILIILFFIGYPIMRWASLTGALQPI